MLWIAQEALRIVPARPDIWEQIKRNLSARMSPEAYQNWLPGTSFLGLEGDTLIVSVPADTTKLFLEREYSQDVYQAIAELRLPCRHVLYEVRGEPNGERIPYRNGQAAAAPAPEPNWSVGTGQLNARFTFETFVVGSCNQFAHAAAHAVATMPSRSYNPLFIYGGSGMGKTHLMHAIGRHLLQNYAGMRIVYTTSERFTNELISSIKSDRIAQFHQHYRSADVLLVDDIHILAGKERTQEEFFFTFNELYDHQKQIVISSDSPPKHIGGLVERLRSRFEWGLMVDVQPPDLETKMAILDKKAEQESINLPRDVRVFLATKTKSSVRELEGALVKLIAYSSVTGTPITLTMAQQVLRHLTQGPERKVSIEAVIKAVGEKLGVTPAQIKQKGNAKNIVYPRQVAMYLVKELTTASLPEIGRAFGGKHHTTVMHSVNKIEELRHRDQEINRLIHSITDSFH
ncbi:MAG TPA: chromosomal replication initiator protein DnaA [Solibacterales bacterium]|nr:chromosomal replication initiator protein DnaA [Bryobacterales bacterium]